MSRVNALRRALHSNPGSSRSVPTSLRGPLLISPNRYRAVIRQCEVLGLAHFSVVPLVCFRISVTCTPRAFTYQDSWVRSRTIGTKSGSTAKSRRKGSTSGGTGKNTAVQSQRNSIKRFLPRKTRIARKTFQEENDKRKTRQAPPAFMAPTASPYVWIASCALTELEVSGVDVNGKQLFSNAKQSRHLFRDCRFRYVSPKEFGYELPTFPIPEVAFIGRSNVGKSSLINALTRNKDLAKTSKTPGRTQQVGYFALFEKSKGRSATAATSSALGFLVDLPGFGYANAPEKAVDKWQQATMDFLVARRDSGNIARVFFLVDARHGMTQFDRVVMQWFDAANIPYTIVMTKTDRAPKNQVIRFLNEVCMRFHSQVYGEAEQVTQGPLVFLTSSKTRDGISDLMSTIHSEFLSFRVGDSSADSGSYGPGG